MITKEYGKHILICDICEEKLDETFNSWQDAVDYRNDNWDKVKITDVFEDVCPACDI